MATTNTSISNSKGKREKVRKTLLKELERRKFNRAIKKYSGTKHKGK